MLARSILGVLVALLFFSRVVLDCWACPLPIPQRSSSVSSKSIRLPIPRAGNNRLLVVLADFSDQPGSFSQLAWASEFFGAQGFATYFSEVSYGQLNYTGDIVGMSGASPVTNQDNVAYVRLPNPKSYYAAGVAGRDVANFPANLVGVYFHAIQALETAGFDFSPWADPVTKQVENVVVIFAGRSSVESRDENNLQPTSYAIELSAGSEYVTGAGYRFNNFTFCPEREATGMAKIGVCAHEHGHSLGMPDLYDFDFTKTGVGYFDLMAYGTFGADNGVRPFHPGAFSKSFFGWVAPQSVPSTGGEYTLPPIETNASVLKLTPSNSTGEYFLLENRALLGFNAGMSAANLCGGLYVWHVDGARFEDFRLPNLVNSPGSAGGPPYHLVQVVERDGRGDLTRSLPQYGECSDRFVQGDLWNDSSTPTSRLFNGSSSGVSVQVLSQLTNGSLNLLINRSNSSTPNPSAGKIKVSVRGKTLSGSFSSTGTRRGLSVQLLKGSKIIASTVTSSTGRFSFKKLKRGTYRVRIQGVLSKRVKVR